MGSPLPRGYQCCSRLTKGASSPPLPSTSPPLPQGRVRSRTGQRRLVISAFLFNPTVNAGSSSSGSNRSKDAITNRLSELRNRSEDEDRAFLHDRSQGDADDEAGELSEADIERARRILGPWPASSVDEAGPNGEGLTLAGAAGAAVTPRSLRYLTSDPKPEIKLLHRFKPGHNPDSDFWRNFVDKCRLAWGVFFPPVPRTRQSGVARWATDLGRLITSGPAASLAPAEGTGVNGLTAKQVVLSRLQMVLIADRCGVSPEQLLEMKAQTLTALAEYMGKDLNDDVAQLEVQVSALKPNGERITMTIGFADMLADEQIRDPLQYHYEFEDDDDYFLPEEDDGRVAEIAEAPAAGLQAARVAAQTIDSTANADGERA